jgi:hypothetical protein
MHQRILFCLLCDMLILQIDKMAQQLRIIVTLSQVMNLQPID